MWMALPIALELRPPLDWEIPQGTVLNADPEPPWPMVLHAGESEAVTESPVSGFVALLPKPAIRQDISDLRTEPNASPRDTAAPVADLLILHQRRNE